MMAVSRWTALALAAVGSLVLTGCPRNYHALPVTDLPVSVALVPGCPTEADGTLSWCQWRRALWAAHLYETGAVSSFITSGNAVYTPFREADSIADGMIALGVPAAAIRREPNALHTDENVAYTLRMLEPLSPNRLIVASDGGQAAGACAMVRAWSTIPCVVAPIDEAWMRSRLAEGLPDVRLVAVEDWIPLKEREAQIAEVTGYRRPSSFWVYFKGAVLGAFGASEPPRLP